MSSYRRECREAAMQFLFQTDPTQALTTETLDAFWKLRHAAEPDAVRISAHQRRKNKKLASAEARQFWLDLVRGVLHHHEEIDAHLRRLLKNYELERVAAVDRSILRIALYEMIHQPDIPPLVSINEAIEIAKRFGGEESGHFVNGVLDRFGQELGRPLRGANAKPKKAAATEADTESDPSDPSDPSE